jgi:DNA helicase-2/ATP-dependent DNA helicase PcrA
VSGPTPPGGLPVGVLRAGDLPRPASPAARRADAGPRFTPDELAALLHLPRPTGEQAAVIAAPVSPLLVVAGAGSGKTETMAARVVWLVANGYVRPEHVLGLTFTRKAAAELATRVRSRLSLLVRHLGRDELITGEPAVATYHAYAARILTEHGVRGGYEPTSRLLTEASRWQLADLVVREYDGDMSAVDSAPTTVVDAVLRLAGDLAEHLVDPDDLAAWTGRFHAQASSLPGHMIKDVTQMLLRQRARLALLPMVRDYAARKRRYEAVDFGDQLARAALVARAHPVVGATERDRYRVVLLDEYQDTSPAQVTLLRALFGGGHPVTAVGDPCQSIYGWRGASAGTLDRFPAEFRQPSGAPAPVRTLSTSWRNRPEILAVANALSAPLRSGDHRVARLSARPAPDAPVGAASVRVALLRTYEEEADWIADRVLRAWWHAAGAPPGTAPDAIAVERRPGTAVLIRSRAQIPVIEAALRARGLPVEVVGLGGLLDTPEVRDVVSMLTVLVDPTAGAALLRVLTGPRWRLGPRDLVALYRRARELAPRRDGAPSGGRLDEATLVEALDDLGDEAGFAPEGYRRLSALARELASLRRRLDQPLADLLVDIERTIGLDVEVAVRPGEAGLARAHLDALGEVAARFAAEADGATLTSFLAYLEAAESEERGLRSGEVEVAEGAVQILTTHAAKGLEWDVVAVAGLCDGLFPGHARASDNWVKGLGVLPFALRGDHGGLPALDLAEAADQKDVGRALARFTEAWRAHHEREERRLAYVSVTRARRLLLCSGYWWGEGLRRFRQLSPFLVEAREACREGAGVVDRWTAQPGPEEENPTAERVPRATWPADPLGGRRTRLEEAAALVRDAGAALAATAGPPPPVAPDDPDDPGDPDDPDVRRWRTEADLLLAERDRLAPDPDRPVPVELPDDLSVSQVVTLGRDPGELARWLRRPMPQRPAPAARRGTAFHRWVESRHRAEGLLDIDELPGAADADAAGDEEIDLLRRRFEEGPWAGRVPVAVEVPFAATVAGVVLRGRMDAVYAGPDGTYEVIDWKTGRLPTGAAARAAAVQLAVYRLAWANLAGVPVGRVSAGFHEVRTGRTVRPVDLLDAAGLAELVTRVPVAEPG